MRTNVDVDGTLLEKAMKLSQAKTKKEAINEGLKALILIKQQKKILKLRGSVTWEGNLAEMRYADWYRATVASAWIEYFNKQANPYQPVVDNHILQGNLVYTCPIVIQEVLQGVTAKDYRRVKSGLSSAVLLTFSNAFQMAVDAAEVYRQCRTRGYTIRKANDCLIAHYALQYNLPLLHRDGDFDHIARVFPLQIAPV